MPIQQFFSYIVYINWNNLNHFPDLFFAIKHYVSSPKHTHYINLITHMVVLCQFQQETEEHRENHDCDCRLMPIQQFFSYIVYHDKNKLIFNEMMMRSDLY
jgi:hypothetical protein